MSTLCNVIFDRVDTEDDYSYFLDADYQQTDNDGNMCVHKNPYIDTTLNETYELFVSELPYNISFLMMSPQKIPHNFTLKYQNGTDFDLSANTWLAVDYSDVKKFTNNDIVITINTPSSITGNTYTASFSFNFYVYNKNPDYLVYEDKYINISVIDEPAISSPLDNKIVT